MYQTKQIKVYMYEIVKGQKRREIFILYLLVTDLLLNLIKKEKKAIKRSLSSLGMPPVLFHCILIFCFDVNSLLSTVFLKSVWGFISIPWIRIQEPGNNCYRSTSECPTVYISKLWNIASFWFNVFIWYLQVFCRLDLTVESLDTCLDT